METEAHGRAYSSFGDLLRQLRLVRGLTQEELAERAGLSVRGISDLERGVKRRPRPDTLALLAQALDLDPTERAHLDRLLHLVPARRASVTPPAPSATRHNLPAQLTSFIGRVQEIAELRELVLAKRLVTLTGPGGIGKTSLVLAVASTLTTRFVDGVALVELAALADGDLVTHAIASVFGVRERPDETILTTLGAALGTTERLLVLDNCEHLLLSCAQVAEALLRACPHLTILATSREPLRIGAEVIWRVPPLPFPPAINSETESNGVEGYEAVRLFVERASAARPGFALTTGNAEAVAEICRRLDGIPLAIELAAARVAALPPEHIARHMNDRFHLLTTGSRTTLPRHQTLRALFDWSYDLLSETERILFRRLAVFAGGLTLPAAQAVCETVEQATNAPVCREEVLDLLLGLVDKSLVLVEERDGEMRFRLLETPREYAREKLDASGAAAAVQAAHAAYFATWAGGPDPQPIETVMQRQVALPLATAAGEMDNLRAALGYFLDQGSAEVGLGLAARIYHLWFLHGPRTEGRAWLRRLLALPDYGQDTSRAAAFFAVGWLALFQGDLTEAGVSFAEAARLAAARGDLAGLSARPDTSRSGCLLTRRGRTRAGRIGGERSTGTGRGCLAGSARKPEPPRVPSHDAGEPSQSEGSAG